VGSAAQDADDAQHGAKRLGERLGWNGTKQGGEAEGMPQDDTRKTMAGILRPFVYLGELTIVSEGIGGLDQPGRDT
jgi:hypothetical protein